MIISLCTSSKNRLSHIKKTLISNLEIIKQYDFAEIVLLNYNSDDEIDDYIKSKCMNYIKNKNLIYAKEDKAIYFEPSRSRNLSFLVSNGDVICNVDADNYIHTDFPNYLYHEFKNRIYPTLVHSNNNYNKNSWGRMAFFKKDFINLGGYDEDMEGYGGEDYDFFVRARNEDWNLVPMPDNFVKKIIQHGNIKRIENMMPKNAKKDYDFMKKSNRKNYTQARRKDAMLYKEMKVWGNAELTINFEDKIKVCGNIKIMGA